MASAVIGSLRVDLSMNSAQFQKGAKQAQSTLGALGNTFKQFAVGAAAALSFGAVTRAIQSVVNKADELGKTAQKIGIPVEALSRLEYAGKLADVSLDQLSIGVGKLAKNMADIAGGKDNDAAKALQSIGVSAVTATGALRPAEAVLLDIATKFAGMRDGAEKTALAMTIFGKSGRDLIPLLNEGAAGIKAMGDEATRFGIVISTQTAAQAEEFNDNITRLREAAGGLTTQITAALLPAMVRLTDAFVSFVSNSSGLQTFLEEGAARFATTRREADALGLAFQKSGIYARAFYENLRLLGSGDFSGGNTVWAKAAEDIKAANAEAARLAAFAQQMVNGEGKGNREGVSSGEGGGGGSGGGGGLPAVAAATNVITEEMRQSAYEARQLNNEVLALSSTVPEAAKATESLGSAFSDVFAGTISSALSDALDGTFKLQDAVKSLIKSLANTAIQNLFSGLSGGAGGTSGGGGGLFAGLGRLFGFAKGGTIFPSGGGGVDSQLVAFRKSPNERVDITRPGQRLERGAGRAGDTYIDARGADAGQVTLLRAEMRDMKQGLDRRILSTVARRKNQDPRYVR